MAACAVFSHPLSVDTRVKATSGIRLHRCATPQQLLRVSSAGPFPFPREARSFPNLPSRSVVSSAVQEYLKSLNYMTRTIVLETETVEKENREKWIGLDQSTREELVNEHFIPSEVRVQYTSGFVGGWQRMPRGTELDNRPLHLSQPTGEEEWKSLMVEGHCEDPTRGENLVTNPDICLSQPLDYSYEPSSSTFTITSRLHKQQRSFRAAAFRSTRLPPAGRQQQQLAARATPSPPMTFATPPLSPCRRLTPCPTPPGDEEDRISLSAPDVEEGRTRSPLGFERNRLRSFSMRPKRGGGGDGGSGSSSRDKTQPAHKSFRGLTTRVKKETPPAANSTAADAGADDKIDLPDERLMTDHVHSQPRGAAFVRQKPERYSKTRLSKSAAVVVAERGAPAQQQQRSAGSSVATATTSPLVSVSPTKFSERSVDVVITPTSPTKSVGGFSVTSASRARRSSQDNLDDISVTSRVSSRLQLHASEDLCSEGSDRLKLTKTTEGASLIPMNRRCGSAYKTSTSDFADRKALFKPNMLKKHKEANSTLSDSREATPTPTPEPTFKHPCVPQDLLKPPPMLLPMTKHNSLVESVTTDLPSSPDHMSPISSPPDTPLTRSPVKCNRESGYLSSSFEVLEDDTLSEKVSLAGNVSSMHHTNMDLMLAMVNIQ